MPRSWSQIGRELVDTVKETVRIHLKKMSTETLPLEIEAWDHAYPIAIETDIFGGTTFQDAARIETLPLGVDMMVTGEIPKIEGIAHNTEIYQHESDIIASIPVQIEAPNIEPFDIYLEKANASGVLKADAFQFTTSAQLLRPSPWKKVSVQGQHLGLRTKAQARNSLKNALPITRQATPPHRFSQGRRNLFRERLAQRAAISAQEVQITGVYDRLFLSLYREVGKQEDGSLTCLPKTGVDLANAEKQALAMYLVLGKSLKPPYQAFQVVVAMADLDNVD